MNHKQLLSTLLLSALATAARAQTVEQLAGQLVRVTTADGRRYCLQGLPEAATRDIPTPVLSIPMNCP